MKRTIVFSILAIFSVALLAGRCRTTTQRPPEIIWEANTPEIPETLETFTATNTQPMSAADGESLASRIGGYARIQMQRTEAPATRPGAVFYRNDADPSTALTMDLNRGDFLFNKGLRAYQGEAHTADLPASEEEAVRLAAEHLRALDLQLPSGESVLAHFGGVNMAIHRKDGTTSTYRKLITVRYDRRLGGLPVLGDSRAVLQLGSRGELAALVWDWRPVSGRTARGSELLRASDLRPTIEKRVADVSGDAAKVVVDRQDLVLYDDGTVIEPAIRVLAQRTYRVRVGKDREPREIVVPFDTIVPVLASPRGSYPDMLRPKELPSEVSTRGKAERPADDDEGTKRQRSKRY
ncbi:MAG TPA: hypothetical protein VGQ36_01475 [Thermoanaerobaculia bacterium]|jgi:hypothetical protein|nr:hypothetical protein [Thermoanaerobaculia bacterium]